MGQSSHRSGVGVWKAQIEVAFSGAFPGSFIHFTAVFFFSWPCDMSE
jgi:hypothetical protein